MNRIIGLLCSVSLVLASPAVPVWAEEPAMVVSSQMIAGQQPEGDGGAAGVVLETGGAGKVSGIGGEEAGFHAADVGEAVETEAPSASGGGPQIAAPSAVLMEASTGQVIFEKDADTKRSPASVTKVMTLILIFDALESGKIKMTDQVVTSAHAKSMGGSQVFLEDRDIIRLNQKTGRASARTGSGARGGF